MRSMTTGVSFTVWFLGEKRSGTFAKRLTGLLISKGFLLLETDSLNWFLIPLSYF